MTDLKTAAQQALNALSCIEYSFCGITDGPSDDTTEEAITALRAALAEPVQEPDLSRCPQCGGPTDNGHDRSIPPSPYFCTKCMAEPVPVAWRFEARHIDTAWGSAVSLKHPGPEGVYMRNVVPLYTAPPQRKPLTKESLLHIYNQLPNWGMDMDSLPQGLEKFARAIEQAHKIEDQP